MTKSLITRCPKCSTAFRVNDDVLSMAKGKVRCGQCFHIFDAKQNTAQPTRAQANSSQHNKATETDAQTPQYSSPNASSHQATTPDTQRTPATSVEEQGNLQRSTMLFTSADEEPVNPEWLQTLFSEEDLSPGSADDFAFSHDSQTRKDKQVQATDSTQKNSALKDSDKESATTSQPNTTAKSSPSNSQADDDLAPWERELAEIEKSIANSVATQPIEKKEGSLKNLKRSDLQDKIEDSLLTQKDEPEPDYMAALHSLAQNASEQGLPTTSSQSTNRLNALSAKETLDPLLGEYQVDQQANTTSKTWLWTLGTLLGIVILMGQVATHFFNEGSHSETFRTFYRTVCTYTGCTLAPFEDIKAISIEHVRIQSHPKQPGALLVNAIMTNNSSFAQPMPKIALEFFDLNGAPVAARLFAPHNYLDKDFLDITYMPPKTPIHIVIPIQDPGDRAVTHQLRIFPSETRSY